MNLARWLRPSAVVGAALGLGSGPAIAYMTPTVPVCGSTSCNVTVGGRGILDSVARNKAFSESRLFAGASVFDVPQSLNVVAGRQRALGAGATLLNLSPFSTLMTAHASGSFGHGLAGSDNFATGGNPVSLLDFHALPMPADAGNSQRNLVPALQSLRLTAPGILTAGLQFGTPRDVVFLTPAPGTLALVGLGAFGLYWIQRRGRRRQS
jgi:hypothetical protein